MDRNTACREAQERAIAVFRRKPAAAHSSSSGGARVGEGLACEYREGERTAVIDMPAILGGDGKGPTPGFHIRAGLAGCVAIGIKFTAVREGIALDAVDVDVTMDFDDAAMFGIGENSAAPLETRIAIAIATSAPWPEVAAMVDRALAADPYFLALRDAQNVTAVVAPKAG